ncbi:hypothetical protein AB0I28_29295 [Phytomonospora sp. NPDC050363]|uniref:hypothetical protein n=1 Tax=Phytomonospora sp. NPDC050363 TaxID=3155642 RepID=UPI0033F96AEC
MSSDNTAAATRGPRVRTFHRWTSIVFTTTTVITALTLAFGGQSLAWVSYVPLLPLAALLATGLFMFFQHYAAKSRRAKG